MTKRILLILNILVCLTAAAKGYDFGVGGIYYRITDPETKEVMVTSKNLAKDENTYKNNITIPSVVTYKGEEYSVTAIDHDAFYICKKLISVTIPESVTTIGNHTFYGCVNLRSIIIPNSVTKIGKGAFRWCENLKSVTLSNSMTEISEEVFGDCKALTSITIPNSVTKIGKGAFCFCENLKSIIIPHLVTEIGDGAFTCCKNLTSVILLSPDISTGPNVFLGCNNLSAIKVPEGMPSTSKTIKAFSNSRWKDLITYADIEMPNEMASPAFDPKAFPVLAVESVTFSDNGDNAIEAGEACTISVKISNSGKGAARGCTLKVRSSAPGISVSDVKLPDIAAGATHSAKVNVKAGMSTVNGKAEFSVMVDEPNGLGTDPTLLAVDTRAFEAPKVVVSDYAVTGSNGAKLEKRVPFDLQVLVQNMAHGTAEDVTVDIAVPNNVFLTEGNPSNKLGKMEGGKTSELNYQLLVNNNYAAATVPVKVTLREKHGKYAESRTIDLQLNEALAQNKIEVKSAAPRQRNDISQATIAGKTELAETDINIPKSAKQRDNTFAIVIGNENYKNEIDVPFAINDATVVGEYLTSTLGIPANHIKIVKDATRNEMIAAVDWLGKVAERYKGCNLIVYYSGHGMPDEATKSAYLIPVDGICSNTRTCYALDEFYRDLSAMGAENVTVLLDACFSGSQRGDGMLTAAKGVKIKPQDTVLGDKMIVLSASQGNQTAYPYHEKSHGLFTYYLLKKLQDTKGDVTIGQLADYVISEVDKLSIVVNDQPQTPAVAVSPSLSATWRGMRW